ncbi:MAG: outer membrane beta-barrel protein [Proteobacteria bacterium]|nr:outer membrane beta-barrel protein [Pseudomonadota bacterium]
MKKYLIAGAAFIASLSSSAFAANFTGPYAGVVLGPNVFQSGYSQSAAANGGGATKANSTNTLFNYGLVAGYGSTFGQYYVGGELTFSTQTGETKYNATSAANTGNAYATIKETYSINPVVRLGAMIAPKTLAFVKLGAAGTQIKVNAQPFTTPALSTTYKKTLWGYSMGLGMETLVTDSVSIRADFTHNIYPTKTFTIANGANATNQGKISPRDNIVRIGASYHFSL